MDAERADRDDEGRGEPELTAAEVVRLEMGPGWTVVPGERAVRAVLPKGDARLPDLKVLRATVPSSDSITLRPTMLERTGAIIQDYRSGTQVTCFSMANGGQLSGSLVVLMSRFTYVMTTAVQKAGLGTIDPLGDRSVFAAVDCTPELLEEHVQPEALTLYVLPGRLTALPFPLDGLNLNLSADAAGQFVPVLSRR